MPVVPTVYGVPVEHSEDALLEAQDSMRTHLARLKLGSRKLQHTIVRIGDLWCGADGTNQMRGPRVPPTLDAVRAVASMIHDERAEVRTQVMTTLSYAEEHTASTFDEILLALDDGTPSVRLHAARLLLQLAPIVPREAIPQLRGRLADPNPSVRWMIVRVLAGRISSNELVAVLLDSLPKPGATRFVIHDWLRAANTLDPMPKALVAPVRDLEALLT
ncbi:MAG: hypothetical protein JWO36_1032 [Myxococcales bacterium]|nr:hypothetical protein [Myxococcales bacterium]